jgi:phosphatidylglycerophosphatase C
MTSPGRGTKKLAGASFGFNNRGPIVSLREPPDATGYAGRVDLQSADQVWARIAAEARLRGGGVIASDGDGTLWSGDVGEDLFHELIERGPIADLALEGMRRQAHEHALSDAGSGPDVARRILAAYHAGRFPEERLCEIMTWCFAGWTRRRVEAFAHDVVDRCGLEGRLHHEVLQVVGRARAAGIPALLVSASPTAVVVAAGARIGFAPDQVVAARARFDGEVMLPEVERPIPYGPGKVSRLLERIGARETLYAAFGDNAFDIALLASARIRVAVRPKARLREREHEVPGLVELREMAPDPG